MTAAEDRLAPFVRWCEENDLTATPAADSTVVTYLMRQPSVTPQDIREFADALTAVHREMGLEDPLARPELRDIVRKLVHLTLPGE